ncbi:SWIM zinc finger family protein [Streptomyces sp. CB02400]|uniref:SWIM zinc finger family protein n=1 Tax=Streptomyces sp. CB02400 TaxID=1703944 RepID=UPI00093A2FFA|nr:SWIM zinc finger family protein [Streptomyces sp. CB02400]OKK05218.1 hypothetical protein AMK33_23780 [Streptomyces sp. CB02400]
MSRSLPPVAPEVFASAVEILTTRLRGRLDAAVEALAGAPVTTEDGTVRVRCGEDARVTLTPGPSGTVTAPGQAHCTCLLAPRCLHLAAVLGACPVADATPAADAAVAADRAQPEGPGRGPGEARGPRRTPAPGPVADTTSAVDVDRPAVQVRPAGRGRFAGSGQGPVEAGGPHGAPGQGRVAGDGRRAGPDRPAAADRPADDGRRAAPGRPSAEKEPLVGSGRRSVLVPSADRTRAASGLWAAGAAVLSAGTAGAGAVLQAELLRAAHTARLAGLHRAEAAALDVVRHLRDERDPHRPRALAALVDALRELLLVTHRLRSADPDPALIGAVRHHHRPDGPLRLYGVCREPVIGPGGLGGVVTHLVDDDGHAYTLPDVKPGGPARARRAGTAHVALRSFLSDHFRVSRGGLIVTGAVVAPDGRLLPEPGVRVTFAAGRPWPPSGPDPDGAGSTASLTARDVEIVATDGEDLLVRVLPGRAAGPVRLAPALRHPSLAHTANLRRLGEHPGLRIRVVGRLDPDRVTTLRPLAVAPVPGAEATLRLPDDWQGRADLGYDHLRDDHFPADLPCPPEPAPAGPVDDSPLWRVRRLVELAVAGGRRAAAEPARGDDLRGHATALRRDGFVTGAALAATLGAVAADRTRDAFGRLDEGGPDRYTAQWLATAVYLTGTEAALRRDNWLGHAPGSAGSAR